MKNIAPGYKCTKCRRVWLGGLAAICWQPFTCWPIPLLVLTVKHHGHFWEVLRRDWKCLSLVVLLNRISCERQDHQPGRRSSRTKRRKRKQRRRNQRQKEDGDDDSDAEKEEKTAAERQISVNIVRYNEDMQLSALPILSVGKCIHIHRQMVMTLDNADETQTHRECYHLHTKPLINHICTAKHTQTLTLR